MARPHDMMIKESATTLVRQFESAQQLFRQSQHDSDAEKMARAMNILSTAILTMASVPGFLKTESFIDEMTGEPGRVEVLCFERLIKVHIGGERVVPCLFRDGLYWVPLRGDGDYVFKNRIPLTQVDILSEIDGLMKAMYFRSLELGGRSLQTADEGKS